MPPSDREIPHECTYLGTHERNPPKSTDKPLPPTADFAQAVALSILGGRVGAYRSGPHVRRRMRERDFDIFDIDYVIRNGACVQGGTFCEEYRNFKYTFRGNIDGVEFDAVFALSADHHLIESPLMVLITGCFKTESGKRSRTY